MGNENKYIICQQEFIQQQNLYNHQQINGIVYIPQSNQRPPIGKYIIKLLEVGLGTSTQEKLFVGTKEECENKIKELALPLASNNSLGEVEQEVIIVPPPPLE